VCAPYFVNLNNNTFQLKSLLFFVHLHSQQKRTEKVISSNQICSAAILTSIVILRVAIISNVRNVRTERRDRPTDDACTRRWRGSQQANNDTFITSLVTLSLSNK